MEHRSRYAFALDLVDDGKSIREYEAYHEKVWPEILKSITESGIKMMEIYRIETRLFMLMEVDESFSFEKKAKMDAENPKVAEWEKLMWNYQKALPSAKPGEKWLLMKKIFSL
ncbi:L-rhamnose mutarotase [Flagellimonas flava]|uniref:L-rhamnose mutarotase n=1 Tax=Flagellimonas flava TaxID=570519 RepID=A0A1M5MAQ7_9FLAO|nr:L-rhamnose mutarotase [Allomuricauda flava]SHG74434.1 L-rhamnose mutarotase [Allomuricauda flava]